MKFTVSSSSLAAAINATSKALGKGNTIAALNSLFFEITPGRLVITGSDTGIEVRCALDVSSSDVGEILIDPLRLVCALKTLSDEPLVFSVDATCKCCEVTHSGGQVSMPCQSGAGYLLMISDGENEIHVSSDDLAEGLRNTIFCAATDLLMVQFSGIFFDIDKDCITLVATNRHQMSKCIVSGHGNNGQYLLPVKYAGILLSLLPKSEDVKIIFGKSNVRIEFGDTVITCRLSQEVFPNYKQIIPQSTLNAIAIDAAVLKNAVERCSVFSGGATGIVVIECSERKLLLRTEDPMFSCSAFESMACDYSGEDIRVAFGAKYLIEILAHIKSDTVNIWLSDYKCPGIFCPENPTLETTYLLMPYDISQLKKL